MGKEILEDLYEELKVIGKLPQGTILECEQKTGETEKEFNDMGVMQALDIVNATLSVIYYLQEQYSSVNTKKVILFGSSHGAYLAHLANLICPRLYASVLDISGYLKPYFLDHIRDVIVRSGDVRVIVKFRYFLHQHPEYRYHNDLYDLRFLYKNRNNTCKIIAVHGKDDRMVDYREREAFIGQLDSAEMLLIDRGDVDGALFDMQKLHDLLIGFTIGIGFHIVSEEKINTTMFIAKVTFSFVKLGKKRVRKVTVRGFIDSVDEVRNIIFKK